MRTRPGRSRLALLISHLVRNPVYENIETDIEEWAIECMKNDILITDDKLKAKALESGARFYLLDLTIRPFVCSPKWLRGVKSRLNIVDGKFLDFDPDADTRPCPSCGIVHIIPPPRDLDEDSAPWPPTFAAHPAIGNDPYDSLSASYANSLRPFTPSAYSSSPTEEYRNFALAGIHDASALVVDETSPYHQSPSPQSSPELYTPDWSSLPERAVTVDHNEMDEKIYATPAPDLQSGSAVQWDMNTSFLWTDVNLMPSGFPALPDVQTSCPPLGPDNSTPAIDYSVGVAPMDGVSIDVPASFDPSLDAPLASPYMRSAYTSPFTSSVDVSAPSMPPTDSSTLFIPQTYVPQEDIDKLAAEMMHWPIEDLLVDSNAAGPGGMPLW